MYCIKKDGQPDRKRDGEKDRDNDNERKKREGGVEESYEKVGGGGGLFCFLFSF